MGAAWMMRKDTQGTKYQHTNLLVTPFHVSYFPCGSDGIESTCKPNPWVGKIPWRRERLPIPVFWPGELHGLCSLRSCKELDTTEQLSRLSNFHFCVSCWVWISVYHTGSQVCVYLDSSGKPLREPGEPWKPLSRQWADASDETKSRVNDSYDTDDLYKCALPGRLGSSPIIADDRTLKFLPSNWLQQLIDTTLK